MNTLLQFDKDHLWHPYTSATKPITSYLVESASGVRLKLDSGEEIIDGMSSWWSTIHGYNHPVLNQAMSTQAQKMSHVMFGGLTHKPAIELGQSLMNILPKGLEHIFYSDSGSVAVEVSMKMALQYYHSQGKGHKNTFITIEKGYHGDTWHTMSVCDPKTGMHHIFNGKLSIQHFLPAPVSINEAFNESQLEHAEQYLKKHHNEIAGFILEPIVQGAGGMRFYHPEYLKGIKALCEKYDILLIADEIATGFGRTGKLFACNHADISPDIICLGKAITGGYMSFAATVCTKNVAHTISNGEPGVFMHGPTFMGNPLACAIAKASIDVLLSQNWEANTNRIENGLHLGLQSLKDHHAVHEVRIFGAIGVVEMKENVDMQNITKTFIDNGVWMRPFGKLVYTMPPFIISDEDLRILTDAICKTIEETYA